MRVVCKTLGCRVTTLAMLDPQGLQPASSPSTPPCEDPPLAPSLKHPSSTSLQLLAGFLGDAERAEAYLAPRHVIDVLADFRPARPRPADVLGTLRQLAPRLYSISSSQLEGAAGVQATVAVVRYESLGAERLGVASTDLAERLGPGAALPIYIHTNPDFRLVWMGAGGGGRGV